MAIRRRSTCSRRAVRSGSLVPPRAWLIETTPPSTKGCVSVSLVGEEDGHERHGERCTQGQCKTAPIAAEKAGKKPGHTGSRDDVVGEGDHACGGGQVRDEGTGPEFGSRVRFRPATILGGEVTGGFG